MSEAKKELDDVERQLHDVEQQLLNQRTNQATSDYLLKERSRLKGIRRSIKNRTRTTLDQTKAMQEIISFNVDDVEAAIKEQLQMRKDSKGGRTTHWEKWISRVDLNWNADMVNGRGEIYYNDIEDMNLWAVADLALRVTMQMKGKKRSLAQTVIALGDFFSLHCWKTVLSETHENRQYLKSLDRITLQDTQDPERRRKKAIRLAKKRGYDADSWTENQKVQVGAVLWNAVVRGTGLFVHDKDQMDEDKWPTYYPQFTPELDAKLKSRNARLDRVAPMHSPMDRPPNKWSGDNNGPYKDYGLAFTVPLVKNMDPVQKQMVEDARDTGQLDLPIKALDLLQEVKYEIDTYVVDAVRWVWENRRDREVKKFPNMTEQVQDRLSPEEYDELEKADKIDLAEEAREIRADNIDAETNHQSVADWLRDADIHAIKEVVHMPHQFDRRFRVYHVSDFGHHKTDCLRAMFRFKDKRPIGNNAAFLALQLANAFGNDKVSLDKRVHWAAANEDVLVAAGTDFTNEKTVFQIFDVQETVDADGEVGFERVPAIDPDTGEEIHQTVYDFWRNAGTPFALLAACHELAELRAYEERNPGRGHEFPSGLPIAMDATQSGGQHFCGASLNYNDAVLTNIVPQDKPNDLYLACLAEARRLLVEKLEEDKATAEADPITPEDQQVIDAFNAFQNDESKTFDELKDNRAEFKQTIAYARLKVLRHIDACERTLAWEGYDRTVMKRNAMTYFYSSRRYGFAEQIRKDTMKELSKKVRLKELKEHPFGKDRGYTASHVLGAIHEQAIENVVESAAQGMAFFRSCADALSRENKQFSFVTRWGAPVRQWYETVAEHPNRPSCWLHSFRTIPRTKKRDEVPAGEIDRACESLSLTKYTGRVDSRKARNAIAPNIIHAQDALLLQMAVLLCAEEGVTDVMVIHDSFATTIANAGVMSQCLRLAFVDLYEDYNLYEDIRDQVLAQLDNPDEAELAPMPKRGDLDLRVILGSDYAFS